MTGSVCGRIPGRYRRIPGIAQPQAAKSVAPEVKPREMWFSFHPAWGNTRDGAGNHSFWFDGALRRKNSRTHRFRAGLVLSVITRRNVMYASCTPPMSVTKRFQDYALSETTVAERLAGVVRFSFLSCLSVVLEKLH